MQVLTEAQWAKFEAAIAAAKLRGARPRKEDRRTIEAIIWRFNNGAKWRSIPAELGDWHHAYLRFRRWVVAGVWDRIMAHVMVAAPSGGGSPAARRARSLPTSGPIEAPQCGRVPRSRQSKSSCGRSTSAAAA
jgi:transposase